MIYYNVFSMRFAIYGVIPSGLCNNQPEGSLSGEGISCDFELQDVRFRHDETYRGGLSYR